MHHSITIACSMGRLLFLTSSSLIPEALSLAGIVPITSFEFDFCSRNPLT